MKSLIVSLLLLISVPTLGQQDTLSYQERLERYYETLTRFNSTVSSLRAQGIDPFKPNFAEEGGGLAYQVFVKTKAFLEAEANSLGLNDVGLSDGTYVATVIYSNPSTRTISTYTLEVKVVENRVVKIDFGNGGYVHTGINYSGYVYEGGRLLLNDGNYIARVRIRSNSSVKNYDVILPAN